MLRFAVRPEVLKSHIAAIRAVLGDDARKPSFIETLSRRGYRFIAPVTEGASARSSPASGPAYDPVSGMGDYVTGTGGTGGAPAAAGGCVGYPLVARSAGPPARRLGAPGRVPETPVAAG